MWIVNNGHHHLITLFKYIKRKKSWDYLIWPQGPLSEMVPSMLIKEPGCQTRARPEKLAEVGIMCVHHNSYMATPEEKQVDVHLKMEW